jgi:hypothetical protein
MAWIDKVLEDDRSVHKKQHHTAQRIFERLRDEEGFSGGYTIVREYVAHGFCLPAAALARPDRRLRLFAPSHRCDAFGGKHARIALVADARDALAEAAVCQASGLPRAERAGHALAVL